MKKILTVILIAVSALAVQAQDPDYIYITSELTDQRWSSGGVGEFIYQPVARVGSQTTNLITGLVLPFLIPDLEGRELIGAELQVTTWQPASAWIPDGLGTAAVYAVRSDVTNLPVASDLTNGTVIAENLFTISANQSGSFRSTSGSAELAQWISGQVASNESAYVFLTVKPTDLLTLNNAYVTLITADGEVNPPQLILNFTTNDLPPSASFSAEPTSGLVSLTVVFTDLSAGAVTNRFWDFGDGTTLSTTNAVIEHTYETPGTYDVELVVTSSGGSDTNTQIGLIVASADANLDAQAEDRQWDSDGASSSVDQTTSRIGAPVIEGGGGASIVTVTNFDFNVAGDDAAARMNWSAGNTVNASSGSDIEGLHATNAVGDAGTTVLTMDYAKSADLKLYYRGSNIALPGGTTGWDKLEIRLRQLDTDMSTPVAFNNSGTIANVYSTGAVLPTMALPASSGTYSSIPITVTDEANGWRVYSFDLTGRAGSFLTNWRIDPLQIYSPAEPGVNSGNFEIDYIKITAVGEGIASGTTNRTVGMVMPFLIPDLNGRQIVGSELQATLSTEISESVTGAGNVDVFGMRSNETNATTVATDYTSAGSLVVDDWFALEGGLSGMQSSGDSATLTSWLNGQMSFGGSRYVFLTARPDLTEIPVNAVAVLITGDSETDKPRLIITVQSEAPGIAAWRMEYFGSSANSGNAANDANPMGDGIPNLVKYALGLDPTVDYTGSPYAPYSEWQESNGFTYTFTYDPETDDVALVIEVTDDLLSETWADLDPFASSNQVSVLDDVPETGLQTITLKTTSLLTRPAS